MLRRTNTEGIDSRRATTNGQKMKIILLLAFPAIIENFFQTILGFVDTYSVSKLSLIEISAVGVIKFDYIYDKSKSE